MQPESMSSVTDGHQPPREGPDFIERGDSSQQNTPHITGKDIKEVVMFTQVRRAQLSPRPSVQPPRELAPIPTALLLPVCRQMPSEAQGTSALLRSPPEPREPATADIPSPCPSCPHAGEATYITGVTWSQHSVTL